MSTVTNLRKVDVEKIQIDEGLIYLDYGEETQRKLAPTRGGGNFVATMTVHDIEFDGRNGKTAGMQTIDEQSASLKVNTICMSQENLALALPGCRITSSNGTITKIKNPKCGVIPAGENDTVYAKNVTMFAKLMDGSFKKITIFAPLHEGGLDVKAVQKAEGELGLELLAHYTTSDLNGDLYDIEEVSVDPQISESAANTNDPTANTNDPTT